MDNYRFFADRPLDVKKNYSFLIISFTILIWGLGIFTLYFCSYSYALNAFSDPLYFVKRQLVASAIGLIGLLFFAICPMSLIRRLLPGLVIGAIILCILTFVPGIKEERNGASRWIKLPFFTFQPSELVKFVLVLFLANFFARYQTKDEDERSTAPAVGVLIGFVMLVLMQNDFSTSVLILFIGIALFFVTGINMKWLISFSTIGIPALLLAVLLKPYRMNRLAAYINQDKFLQDANYQSFLAKRAISTGGFWGQGIGSGLERLNSIPEVQADYIFAGWAEAMGFVGVLSLFIIIFAFAFYACRVSLSCKDRFAAIGTFGCGLTIFVQFIVNCAVVCGVFPTTGLPLPFFSSGGSSMIITLCMCGFMINAAGIKDTDENLMEVGEFYE